MPNPFNNFQNLGTLRENFEEYEPSLGDDRRQNVEQENDKPNLTWYYLIYYLLGIILIFKLLDLQISQGSLNQYLAEGNRIRTRDIVASRGNIYDANNNILAKNIASFNLEILPADLPQDKVERNKIYQEIEKNTGIVLDTIEKKIEEKGLFSLDPVILQENIPRDEALLLEIRFKDFTGVIIDKRSVRQYQQVLGLSHILGYIGKISQEELDKNINYQISDYLGKSGLELIYEKDLRGENGKEQIEVNSLGRIQRILATKQPNPGNNLFLTIDFNLQEKMAEYLKIASDKLGGKEAVAIAQNPQTGGILGLVNIPSYDNNIFSQPNMMEEYQKLLDNSSKPMINRAISGVYPSGSTIKPIIAAAGLQEKVISVNTTINDPGEIKIGDWSFPDWKNHGLVDVKKAIAESCDVFFYAVGGGWDKISGLGVKRIDEYLEKFGFGEKSNIDLPGEGSGLVPSPEWKKRVKKESWYIGDTYHLSIGQGDLLVTPLQLINAISMIANGGKLYQPYLLLKETDSNGKLIKEFFPKIIRDNVIGSFELSVVRQGMRQAVESGSARSLQDLPIQSAGKTGTAQFGNNKETHSWFVSFAPYENPQISLLVLIEGGGEGNETALPVAKEILNYYFARE